MALRYVALGNSYTIGTGVRPPDRWPDQLCAALGDDAGARARRQSRGQRLHLGRPHPPRAAGARGAGARVRVRPDRGQRRRPGGLRRRGTRRTSWSSSTRSSSACPPTGSSPSRSPTTRSRPPAPSSAIRASAHAAIVAANAVMAEQARARGIGWVDIFDLSRRAAERAEPGGERWAPSRVEPSTPCGSSGSCRSWRAGSRADRPARRFARSPERRPGNEAPASLAIGQQPHDRSAASARLSGRPVHPDRTTDGGHPMARLRRTRTRSRRHPSGSRTSCSRRSIGHMRLPARSPAEVDTRPGGRRRSRQ